MDKDIEDVLNHYYNDSRSDKTQEELDREFEEFKKIMNEYNAEMMRIEEEQTEKDNIILDKIKDLVSDEEFEEIEDVIEMSENAFDFSIEEKPLGEFQREEEYDHIEGIWVNQTTNGGYIGDEFAGTISIKIQDDKYFQFHYYM